MKRKYQAPIKPELQGHTSDEDLHDLLQLAANFATEGMVKEALLIRRAFDDLSGYPLPLKGMHTN